MLFDIVFVTLSLDGKKLLLADKFPATKAAMAERSLAALDSMLPYMIDGNL